MTKIQIAEAKKNFAAILRGSQNGETYMIVSGQRQEPVACLMPPQVYEQIEQKEKRQISYGIFASPGFHLPDVIPKMTEDEMIGL